MSETKQENVIMGGKYRSNLLLPWLTTDLSLTNKRFTGYDRNTTLGLIPLGKNEITIPIKQISSIGISTKFHFKRFIFGLLFTLFGIVNLLSLELSGLILLIIGLVPLLNSYTTSIQISNNAGQRFAISISILEKGNLQGFASTANNTIAKEVI